MKVTQSRKFKAALCFIAMGLLSSFTFKVLAQENYSKIPEMPNIEFLGGDDRWGCEVLLCLANPNGPKAVNECVSPINKLFKCLAKTHPCSFPKCPMAGAEIMQSRLRTDLTLVLCTAWKTHLKAM